MERAFERADGNDVTTKKKQNSDGIYHSLVGRIDPHSMNEEGPNKKQYSIAFPKCKSSACLEESTSLLPKVATHNIFQHLNLVRKTEHGLSIPSSWYQFSTCKIQTSCPESDEEELSATMNENEADKSLRGDITQEAWSPTPAEVHPQVNIEKQQSTTMITDRPQPQPTKYQGRIRIISNKGATIREVFDIDKSNIVIGKLTEADERYFIEKKSLPPPPISLDDSDDDENDDECVAVVRYKIALESSDLVLLSQTDMHGWISDRGRLAEDSYMILKEL